MTTRTLPAICLIAAAVALRPGFCFAADAAVGRGGSSESSSELPAQQPAQPALLIKAADAIRGEHERQLHVRRQLDAAAEGLRGVIDDLQSNGLLEQSDGDRLRHAVDSVGSVGAEDVARAADLLDQAYKAIPAPAPHLKSAGTEIQSAARKLSDLLLRAASSSAREEMGREIRQMIAKQKQVRDDTAAVAEKRYKEKKDTAMEGRLLAGEQSAIDKAAQRLAQTVDEALKAQAEPQDRGAYEDVQQAMADGKLAEHLRSATQEAAAQNYLSAMQHQEQALKALEAMAAASDAVPDANAADAIERLEQLRDKLADALRKQEQLTAKTDQTPGDALMRQAPALKGEQAGLREQVKDIDPSQFRAEQPAPQPTATPEAAGIRELAEQQKQLTQDTAARDAAGQDVQQLQPTQDGLARKAGELADAASTPEVKSALRQAQAEMQKSSQALASNQPQQAAEPQKLAQQALAQALQQAENAANPQQQPSAADQPQNPIASALDQMQKATDALAKPEQPEAVQHQRQAENALRQAVGQLDHAIQQARMQREMAPFSDELAEARQLAQALNDMLKQQQGLKQQTDAKARQGKAAKSLESPQRQLAARAENTAKSAAYPVQQPLQEAGQHMNNAASQLQADQPADAGQEQQQAIEDLQQALQQANELVAQLEAQQREWQKMLEEYAKARELANRIAGLERQQRNLHDNTARDANQGKQVQPQGRLQQSLGQKTQQAAQDAGGNPAEQPLQQAEQAMEQAAQALNREQSADALAAQQQAIDALQQARELAEARAGQLAAAMGQQPGGRPGAHPGSQPGAPGPAMGMGKGMIPAPGSAMVPLQPQQALVSGEGDRYFTKGSPGGAAPDDKQSRWQSLGPREREALSQNFSRELPIEYRGILKEYFEALAKE